MPLDTPDSGAGPPAAVDAQAELAALNDAVLALSEARPAGSLTPHDLDGFRRDVRAMSAAYQTEAARLFGIGRSASLPAPHWPAMEMQQRLLMEGITRLSQQVRQVAAGAFAAGGTVSTGGPGGPRGTDTIPAWLTPGEEVINAQSAAANRHLLKRINAAKGPVEYQAKGGTAGEGVRAPAHHAVYDIPPRRGPDPGTAEHAAAVASASSVYRSRFPNIQETHRFGHTSYLSADVEGGRRVDLAHDARQNRVTVGFANIDGQGAFSSRPELRGGSMGLVHGLAGLAKELAPTGAEIAYGQPSDARRARLYAQMLLKAGYAPEPIQQPKSGTGGVANHVWIPSAGMSPEEIRGRAAEYKRQLAYERMPERHAEGGTAGSDVMSAIRGTFPDAYLFEQFRHIGHHIARTPDGRGVSLVHNEKKNRVTVDFANSYQSGLPLLGSGKELRPGSLDLMRQLGGLAGGLAQAGAQIAYHTPSDRRRAQLYVRGLLAAGYAPEGIERGREGPEHVWTPAAGMSEEEVAARKAKYLKSLSRMSIPERHAGGGTAGNPLDARLAGGETQRDFYRRVEGATHERPDGPAFAGAFRRAVEARVAGVTEAMYFPRKGVTSLVANGEEVHVWPGAESLDDVERVRLTGARLRGPDPRNKNWVTLHPGMSEEEIGYYLGSAFGSEVPKDVREKYARRDREDRERRRAQHHAGGGTAGHPGSPQGTDTVAAWLTPGEEVINAQSSAANRALLKRINAARGPVHLAGGGTTPFPSLAGEFAQPAGESAPVAAFPSSMRSRGPVPFPSMAGMFVPPAPPSPPAQPPAAPGSRFQSRYEGEVAGLQRMVELEKERATWSKSPEGKKVLEERKRLTQDLALLERGNAHRTDPNAQSGMGQAMAGMDQYASSVAKVSALATAGMLAMASQAGAMNVWPTLTESVRGLQIELGGAFLPTVEKVSERIQQVTSYFEGMDDATKKNVASWVAIGAVGIGFAAVLAKVTTATYSTVVAMQALRAATLANPWAVGIAGLVGLAAAAAGAAGSYALLKDNAGAAGAAAGGVRGAGAAGGKGESAENLIRPEELLKSTALRDEDKRRLEKAGKSPEDFARELNELRKQAAGDLTELQKKSGASAAADIPARKKADEIVGEARKKRAEAEAEIDREIPPEMKLRKTGFGQMTSYDANKWKRDEAKERAQIEVEKETARKLKEAGLGEFTPKQVYEAVTRRQPVALPADRSRDEALKQAEARAKALDSLSRRAGGEPSGSGAMQAYSGFPQSKVLDLQAYADSLQTAALKPEGDLQVRNQEKIIANLDKTNDKLEAVINRLERIETRTGNPFR